MSEDSHRISKSVGRSKLENPIVFVSFQQYYTFDTLTNVDENRSLDHHESDTVSDAGTYIIDDDDSEQKIPSSSSSFKRYVNPAKARHGTFDIHGLISSTSHTIHRPIVDSNLQKKDLSLSSSNSSLLSFNEDEENKSSIQNQIKPPESFGKKKKEKFKRFFFQFIPHSYCTGI
jgi:hypothetical protein